MATIAERLAMAAQAQVAAPASVAAPTGATGQQYQVTPFAPFAQVPAPAAAPPPAPPVQAPLPPFTGFPAPVQAPAAVSPFGPTPTYVAPPVQAPFAGVNPPEAAMAAPLPPMPVAPPAPEKTRKPRGPNKPKPEVVFGGFATPAVVPVGAGACEVTITITHENGVSMTIPAPAEIAESFTSILGPQLSAMV